MKRFAMTTGKLMNYYETVMRPVISSVWQSSLTVDERRRLKAIQKRSIMIISGANDNAVYCFYITFGLPRRGGGCHPHVFFKRHFCSWRIFPKRVHEPVGYTSVGEQNLKKFAPLSICIIILIMINVT